MNLLLLDSSFKSIDFDKQLQDDGEFLLGQRIIPKVLFAADDVVENELLEVMIEAEIDMGSDRIMDFIYFERQNPSVEFLPEVFTAPLEELPKDLEFLIGEIMRIAGGNDRVDDLEDVPYLVDSHQGVPHALDQPDSDVLRHINISSIESSIDFMKYLQTDLQLLLLDQPVIGLLYQLLTISRLHDDCSILCDQG